MSMENDLLKAYRESMEHLESISAFELMKKSALLTDDLKKLVDSQHLPPIIIIGCLMAEVHRLSAEPNDILFDAKLVESFELFKKYVDKKFMKKE